MSGNIKILINKLRIMIQFSRSLMRLFFAPLSYKNKRILGIWDYRYLPWSIGDVLAFNEMLSVLKIKNNAEAVDICIIYDPENPAGIRRETKINSDNAQEYMLQYLSLFSTLPYLGSIFQFKSRGEFNRFLKNNLYRYNTYPPLFKYLSGLFTYLNDAPHLQDIEEFYETRGYIPFLEIDNASLLWAKDFFSKNLGKDKFPIAISLRHSPGDSERNADTKVWLAFMDKCAVDFPEVIFVMVGTRSEICKELSGRKNILTAKSLGTNLLEDLALIRSSLIYMCTESGINQIARFSDLPYLSFQSHIRSKERRWGLKNGQNYIFSNEFQKTFSVHRPVTPEVLYEEFNNLYNKLNKDKWKEQILLEKK